MEERRIWEIDILRVIAIILMVTFHGVYDLTEFVGLNLNYLSGFWYWVGKTSALLFIFLSGISSGLGKRNTVKRGMKVLGLGMAITLVTYIFLQEQYVRFGILHLLGGSMILFSFLEKMKNWFLALISIVIALAAIPLNHISVRTSLLLPFGVMHYGFSTVDYYPLIPYLSVFILGVIIYKIHYYRKQSLMKQKYQNPVIAEISKHSLLIYLIHQPLMLGIIFGLKFLGII